ncbi:MAG TPA: 2-phospho-L-lactate transferase [Actinomycetes bacterium]|nr:2-phospho-L-lactate transferase [Actinomycetes bacterium]
MRITALAGGVGGARFLRGLRDDLAADPTYGPQGPDPAEITVVVNTADDITLFGLRVCPDLDSVMYTLGGGIDEDRGWGRGSESFVVKEELAAYGAEPQWFGLGDRDLATHIVRTRMLDQGYPLSAVTEALCSRWQPGVRLLPMSDDRVETHVTIGSGEDRRAVHFQEWWVRLRAAEPASAIAPVGIEDARPAPGVLEAIERAQVILLPPSNPVVSIGPVVAVPGVRDALLGAPAPVVGVSPIIGTAPVHGMADACLAALGLPTSAEVVARLYEPFLDGWLVAEQDAGTVVAPSITLRARPLLMSSAEATRALARAAFDLALELAPEVAT